MFNLSSVRRLFTWRSPETGEASHAGFFRCGWVAHSLFFLRESQRSGGSHRTKICPFLSCSSFLDLYLFPITLKWSISHKQLCCICILLTINPQSVLLKESQLFRTARQSMHAMSDSWFSGVICWMAGSDQKAAILNEEATLPLITLNPGENVSRRITYATLGN